MARARRLQFSLAIMILCLFHQIELSMNSCSSLLIFGITQIGSRLRHREALGRKTRSRSSRSRREFHRSEYVPPSMGRRRSSGNCAVWWLPPIWCFAGASSLWRFRQRRFADVGLL